MRSGPLSSAALAPSFSGMSKGAEAADEWQPFRIQWRYARFQSIGRAQGRYLLLMVVTAGFAVAAQWTAGDRLAVPFIGLDVPRQLAVAGTVTVISLLTLGF